MRGQSHAGAAPGSLSRLHLIMFALLAGAVLLLNLVFMPMHSNDDEDHFAIAYAAAHFQLGPVPTPDATVSSGSYVDAAIPEMVRKNFVAMNLEGKAVPTRTEWTGRQIYHPLPASVYLPLIYLPQMAAIRIGEASGMNVENTLRLARVVNGLAALTVLAGVIAFLPEGLGLFVLLVLSLPKSLQVFASNSADPMIHAVTLAVIAAFVRALSGNWKPRRWHYALLALGIFAIGGVRPPLAGMGLPLLYIAWRQRSQAGMAFSAAAMAGAVGWWLAVLPVYHDLRCPVSGTLAEKALHFMQAGPGMIGATLAERGTYYWGSFIGELGRGDARIGYLKALPLPVYALSTIMLLLGLAGLGEPRLRWPLLARAVPVITALAIAGGIFFSLSIACTVLGKSVIEGVQGRYFVTPLLLVAAVLASLLPRFELPTSLVRRVLPLFLIANVVIVAVINYRLYWIA